MQKVVLVLAALCFLGSSVFGQGYRGKDFWIAFGRNARPERNHNESITLHIAAEHRSHGTVEFQNGDSPMTVGVEGGAATSIELDTSLQILSYGSPERKAIHLSFDNDVTVTVLMRRSASTDSYEGIPTSLLGNQYIVAGYSPLRDFSTEAIVTATEDTTLVSLRLADSISNFDDSLKNYPKRRTVTFFLNRGQSLRYVSQRATELGDLSGSILTASKPVSFVTGHSCAQVPGDVSFCDVLAEMEPPATKLGTDFLIPQFALKPSYVIRVFAAQDSTTVRYRDSIVARLNTGEFWESPIATTDVHVLTSQPSLVAQYATGWQADSFAVGDPFMLFVTPRERFITEATTVTLTSGLWEHFLTVVMRREDVAELLVDGNPPVDQSSPSASPRSARATISSMPSVASQQLPSAGVNDNLSGYSVLRWKLTPGRHLVQSSRPFALYQYGFGVESNAYDSYGHSCGEDLSK